MRNEVIFDDRGRPDILVVFTPDEAKAPGHIKRQEGEGVRDQQVPQHHDRRQALLSPLHASGRQCQSRRGDPGSARQKAPAGTLSLTTSGRRGTPELGERHRAHRKHQQRQKPQPPEQKGTTYKNSYGKTLTGSGRSGGTTTGQRKAWPDMVGNVWEHVGGVRFLNGQVQIIPNNEAAAGADQSPDSKEWTAIYTPDGIRFTTT